MDVKFVSYTIEGLFLLVDVIVVVVVIVIAFVMVVDIVTHNSMCICFQRWLISFTIVISRQFVINVI